MPRICTSGNESLDFCMKCMPSEKQAIRQYDTSDEGPDDRGNCFSYDAEHPDYDHSYTCVICNSPLEDWDY